jgi:hypothetical protein
MHAISDASCGRIILRFRCKLRGGSRLRFPAPVSGGFRRAVPSYFNPPFRGRSSGRFPPALVAVFGTGVGRVRAAVFGRRFSEFVLWVPWVPREGGVVLCDVLTGEVNRGLRAFAAAAVGLLVTVCPSPIHPSLKNRVASFESTTGPVRRACPSTSEATYSTVVPMMGVFNNQMRS